MTDKQPKRPRDPSQRAKEIVDLATGGPEHTYPSKYPKGVHWAVDEAWEILDHIKPGIISDDVRAFLAGSIAGTIMKYAIQGTPKGEQNVNARRAGIEPGQ